MIDFHCHLDLYPDAVKLLPTVAARNAFTLVVTTSPRAWQATSRVFAGYDNIKVAVGMHPEVVDKKASERALLVSCISKTRFVGEVGLDGSHRYQKTMPPAYHNDTAVQSSLVRPSPRMIYALTNVYVPNHDIVPTNDAGTDAAMIP